jgi:hypothetical protein
MPVTPKLIEKKRRLEERLKAAQLECRFLELELRDVEMSIELALRDKRTEQILEKLQKAVDEWR